MMISRSVVRLSQNWQLVTFASIHHHQNSNISFERKSFNLTFRIGLPTPLLFEVLSQQHPNTPGVLDDRDVLDDAGDCVRVLNISLGSSTESFIKIQHQNLVKIAPILQVSSWSLG